jgi:8-oxo-dGTP diphosphatase
VSIRCRAGGSKSAKPFTPRCIARSKRTALTIEIADLAAWREVLPATTGSGHYVILSFAARWSAGEVVLNEELDDHKWLAPDALGELKVTEGLFDVIQSARRVLGAT